MARRPAGKSRGGNPMAALGIFDTSQFTTQIPDDPLGDDSADEGDLEAELDALLSGKVKKPVKKKKPAGMNLKEIERMTANIMNDNLDDDDDGGSDLENDTELLAELEALGVDADETPPPVAPAARATRPQDLPTQADAQPSAPVLTPNSGDSPKSPQDVVDILQERINNYKEAEAAAKELGDNSKLRRITRSLKTLEGQIKMAKLGKAIPADQIPPMMAIPKAKPDPLVQPMSEDPAEIPKTEDPAVTGPEEARDLPAPLRPSPAAPPLQPRINHSGTYPPPDIAAALGDLDDDLDDVYDEKPAPIVPQTEPVSAPPSLPPRNPPAALPAPTPIRPAPQVPVPTKEPTETKGLLALRRDQYKAAAAMAMKEKNIDRAKVYMKTSKQFDAVLQAMIAGKPVDLSKMPPAPAEFRARVAPAVMEQPSQPVVLVRDAPAEATGDNEIPPSLNIFNAPPAPTNILEALEQRLAKYRQTAEEAAKEENSSKARRLGRVVKQYQDAIKDYKRGKPVDFAELPTPPGFAPIPTGQPPADPSTSSTPAPPISAPAPVAKPAPPPETVPTPSASSNVPSAASSRTPPRPAVSPSARPSPPKQQVKRHPSTTLEKQRQFLLERQELFKEAAKAAMKNQCTEQAREYLKISLGMKPMLEANSAGLPVDLSTIPVPPQMEKDFEIVESEDCDRQLSTDTDELYRTLEIELEKQHKMCVTNKDHFFKLGDVDSGTKFEKFAQETKRDLIVIKSSWKRNDPPPRFHYEDRVFTNIRHNHDVPEDKMQVTVVRGITLPGKPNELDTYVKIDFAYPSDAPQTYRGYTCKDTTNPEYNTVTDFSVARKSRVFLRALKRTALKVEVWQKKGFLRADVMIGCVNVKLQDLETKCEIHEVFPLIDGRKDTGGKLEIKIRVTEPFVAKQVEEIKERWLVIGS